MKVFEFEGTIYKGDIIEDIVNYVATKKEKYKKFLPIAKPMISLYKLNFLSLDKLSKFANKYIKDIDISKKNLLITAEDFWKENEDKLDKDLIKKIKSKDLVITMLPVDFLKPIKLKNKNYLGSIYNYDTNEIELICYKEARTEAFLKDYSDAEIEEYYTSNKDDKEIIKRAKNSIIVEKK